MAASFTRPVIHNVKFHFKLKSIISEETLQNISQSKSSRWGNYFTVRLSQHSKIVYSIFPAAKFVNITGVGTFECIPQVLAEFNSIFKTCVRNEDVTVDNSTAAGSFCQPGGIRLNLLCIKQFLDRAPSAFTSSRITLYPRFFPAAVLRTRYEPTVLLFASGKYTIVGAKSPEQIQTSYRKLCVIIQSVMTTTPQAIAYA